MLQRAPQETVVLLDSSVDSGSVDDSEGDEELAEGAESGDDDIEIDLG